MNPIEQLEKQQKERDKLLTERVRQIMIDQGLTPEIYGNMIRLHDLAAGLNEYLWYAVFLRDGQFESCLMYDINRTAKDVCLESTIESYDHFMKIKEVGFEGYKKYLQTKRFD